MLENSAPRRGSHEDKMKSPLCLTSIGVNANGETTKDASIQIIAEAAQAKRCVSLDRQSTLLRSSIFIFGFCFSEIAKQVGNFWLTTSYNKFPIPLPLFIVTVEMVKLCIISVYLMVLQVKSETRFVGFSIKFSAPASCYFFTNLLYLNALTYTSPPIWMVLIQTRVLYTALIYKGIFKKSVSILQAAGCILIVVSIYGTRLSEISSHHLTIGVGLLLISQLSAALSSIASVTVEMALKNDHRSFPEQQFWLYLWGTILGITSLVTYPDSVGIVAVLKEVGSSTQKVTQLLFVISASTLAGLCVPCIIRNLDSIVKDYVAAFNNLLLAIITASLFPTYFQINYMYGVSLMLLLVGILFYERKNCHSLWSLGKV